MKYLQKSFNFFLSDGGISQEDWEAIFGKKEEGREGKSAQPSNGKEARSRGAKEAEPPRPASR